MKAKVTMSLDEYNEIIQRMERAETQLTTFCDVLFERAWMGPISRRLRYDEEYIDQMLEEYGYDVKGRIEELSKEYGYDVKGRIEELSKEYGYDVKGRIEELSKEYDKDHEDHDLDPITIPEGVDDDLPFV